MLCFAYFAVWANLKIRRTVFRPDDGCRQKYF